MPQPSLPELVGARIRVLRKVAGLTQAQVAESSGLAVETVSRLENGQNMTLEVAGSVADAIGVPVAALFEGVTTAAGTPTPWENRIIALVRGLDEDAKSAVYTALRHMVSVRNPAPARGKGRGRRST